MKPEKIDNLDYDNYVYAVCKCPVPFGYAIKIKKKSGQVEYPFKCDNCGTEGVVIKKEEKDGNDR